MLQIRNTKDFTLGTISLAISLWLTLDEGLVTGFTLSHRTPFLGRPDVYVRMIAAVWAVLSVLLVLKSISLRDEKSERVKFEFNLPLVALLPMIAFVIYAFFLENIGFFISSLCLMFFLCFLFQIKEKELRIGINRSTFNAISISLIFSFLTVIILQKIFIHLLNVRLP